MLTASALVVCGMLWAVLFSVYYTAFLFLLGVGTFLPLAFQNRRIWQIRGVVLAGVLILTFSTYHLPITEINQQVNELAGKPRKDINIFTTRDKMGIFGLHVVMGLVAIPLYPEAAKETLLMILPRPENGTRVFKSDFPLASENVRKYLIQFNRLLQTETTRDTVTKTYRIAWLPSQYVLGAQETRFALALNPVSAALTATRSGDSWKVAVRLRVECRFPKNSSVMLLTDPELRIEEGLFWVLQQSGWLHPYTAEWRFTVDAAELA